LAEAIAYSRMNSRRYRKPKKISSEEFNTPIAPGSYGHHQGYMIAVPRISGIARESYVRKKEIARNKEKMLEVDRESIGEIILKIAITHRLGIAIRDIKLDGLMIDEFEQRPSAYWIDMNLAVIIPDPDHMEKASVEVDDLMNDLFRLSQVKSSDLLRRQELVSYLDELIIKFEENQNQKIGSLTLMVEEMKRIVSEILKGSSLQNVNKIFNLGVERALASGQEIRTYAPLEPDFIDAIRSFFIGRSSKNIYLDEIRAYLAYFKAGRKGIQEILDQEQRLLVIVESIKNSEFNEVFDEIANKIGFYDASLSKLAGADNLRMTYLDDHIKTKLRSKITEIKFSSWKIVHSTRSKETYDSYIKIWYKAFQEECNKDWRELVELIYKTDLWGTPSIKSDDALAGYNSLIIEREELTEGLSKSEKSLSELREKFDQLDGQIAKTLQASIE